MQTTPSPLSAFRKILVDTVNDLSLTFSEKKPLWAQWTQDDVLSDEEVQLVFDHCVSELPKYFFDILYQNEEMFSKGTPVMVFPGVDFCPLFHCNEITASTKKSMWNYLQLLLFNVIGTLKDKSKFGGAETAFADMKEEDLLRKLTETIQSMGSFFQEGGIPSAKTDESSSSSSSIPQDIPMPNAEELYGHLRGLFDGKIGSLAKEMAEEIADDLSGLLGDDFKDVKSTKDVMENLMKDPKKIANLVKAVRDKLNKKISSGEITQEEMMQEAQSIFGKMGDLDGGMKDLFAMMAKLTGKDLSHMMDQFGGMDQQPKTQTMYQGQGVRTGGVGISSTMKEKMKNRIINKKNKLAEEMLQEQQRKMDAEKKYVPYTFDDEETKVDKKKRKVKWSKEKIITTYLLWKVTIINLLRVRGTKVPLRPLLTPFRGPSFLFL